jgi:hypothetical protein
MVQAQFVHQLPEPASPDLIIINAESKQQQTRPLMANNPKFSASPAFLLSFVAVKNLSEKRSGCRLIM